MMQDGIYPKEVTFTDTGFTSAVHTSAASDLIEIGGSVSDEHRFTVKASERIDFTLSTSAYAAADPVNEALLLWSPENIVSYVPAVRVNGEGLYLIRREKGEGCTVRVTDFGFDTDFSGVSAHLVLNYSFSARRVYDESEITGISQEFMQALQNRYSEDMPYEDLITVKAEGDAVLLPVNPFSYSIYLTDADYPANMIEKTDTIGYQFVLNENAEWEFSLNGTEFIPGNISFDYGVVTDDYPDSSIFEKEVIYYRTPSLVLIDSDLVEREETAADQWIKENKERLQKAEEQNKEKEKEKAEQAQKEEAAEETETASEPASKNSSLPVILTVCAIAAAAGVLLLRKRK